MALKEKRITSALATSNQAAAEHYQKNYPVKRVITIDPERMRKRFSEPRANQPKTPAWAKNNQVFDHIPSRIVRGGYLEVTSGDTVYLDPKKAEPRHKAEESELEQRLQITVEELTHPNSPDGLDVFWLVSITYQSNIDNVPVRRLCQLLVSAHFDKPLTKEEVEAGFNNKMNSNFGLVEHPQATQFQVAHVADYEQTKQNIAKGEISSLEAFPIPQEWAILFVAGRMLPYEVFDAMMHVTPETTDFAGNSLITKEFDELEQEWEMINTAPLFGVAALARILLKIDVNHQSIPVRTMSSQIHRPPAILQAIPWQQEKV